MIANSYQILYFLVANDSLKVRFQRIESSSLRWHKVKQYEQYVRKGYFKPFENTEFDDQIQSPLLL